MPAIALHAQVAVPWECAWPQQLLPPSSCSRPATPPAQATACTGGQTSSCAGSDDAVGWSPPVHPSRSSPCSCFLHMSATTSELRDGWRHRAESDDLGGVPLAFLTKAGERIAFLHEQRKKRNERLVCTRAVQASPMGARGSSSSFAALPRPSLSPSNSFRSFPQSGSFAFFCVNPERSRDARTVLPRKAPRSSKPPGLRPRPSLFSPSRAFFMLSPPLSPHAQEPFAHAALRTARPQAAIFPAFLRSPPPLPRVLSLFPRVPSVPSPIPRSSHSPLRFLALFQLLSLALFQLLSLFLALFPSFPLPRVPSLPALPRVPYSPRSSPLPRAQAFLP